MDVFPNPPAFGERQEGRERREEPDEQDALLMSASGTESVAK